MTQRAVLPTVLGLVAIVLWGTMIPVSRHAVEQLGTFTSAAAVYLVSGVLGCLYLQGAGKLVATVRQSPRKYLLICGGLMVAYTVLLYLAIGLAVGRQEIVAVTVTNYLWPGLTLVLSIPLLGNKARGWLLAAGTVVSTAGVWLAVGGGEGAVSASGPRAPVVAALVAAVAWGLYSNLSRRWAARAGNTAMPLFILATGICLVLLRLTVSERSTWSMAAIIEVAYLAVFPTLVAYTFWDLAMQKGNLALVAAASYSTPILSVFVSSLYLGLPITTAQWLASALVVLGAVGCRLSMRQAPEG